MVALSAGYLNRLGEGRLAERDVVGVARGAGGERPRHQFRVIDLARDRHRLVVG